MNIEVIGSIVWLLTLVVAALTFFPKAALIIALLLALVGATIVSMVAVVIVVLSLNDWYSRRFP